MNRKRKFQNLVIPFYGGSHPSFFDIERRCMDRDGKVIDYLNRHLPDGSILDVGAGNGYAAACLTTSRREIVMLESDVGRVDLNESEVWTWRAAQHIPFPADSFDAAYSAWAFFFDDTETIESGLRELNRVVKAGAPIFILDNAGGDEFCSLTPNNIASNRAWWRTRGFQETIIETSLKFDSLEEANKLLGFYFGDSVGAGNTKTTIGYNVVAYSREASGQ